MGYQMVDRGKFKLFERQETVQFQTDTANADAVAKMEASGNRTDGDMDMTSLEERMGRVIRVGTFIDQIKRLNPALIFEISTGDPSKYGIYRPDPTSIFGRAFITGCESGLTLGNRINEGVMPEFSVIVTKEEEVLDKDNQVKTVKKFDREIRGWRTVLAALYVSRQLTEAQIESTFKISQGKDSENWARKTKPGLVTV